MNIRNFKKWYHATDIETAEKIVASGVLDPNYSHPTSTGETNVPAVFLSSSAEDAGRFMQYRGLTEYALFKIQRRDIDLNYTQVNPCVSSNLFLFKPDTVTICTHKPVAIRNYTVKQTRDLEYIVPDFVEVFTENNGRRIGIKLAQGESTQDALHAWAQTQPWAKEFNQAIISEETV